MAAFRMYSGRPWLRWLNCLLHTKNQPRMTSGLWRICFPPPTASFHYFFLLFLKCNAWSGLSPSSNVYSLLKLLILRLHWTFRKSSWSWASAAQRQEKVRKGDKLHLRLFSTALLQPYLRSHASNNTILAAYKIQFMLNIYLLLYLTNLTKP